MVAISEQKSEITENAYAPRVREMEAGVCLKPAWMPVPALCQHKENNLKMPAIKIEPSLLLGISFSESLLIL